jgi:tRNA(His) 5'-end guanylyltransferase
MNAAAKAVVSEHPDIVIAYGVSDEYRFVAAASAEDLIID